MDVMGSDHRKSWPKDGAARVLVCKVKGAKKSGREAFLSGLSVHRWLVRS